MIPVRVAGDVRPPEVGGMRHVAMTHQLAGTECPVCDDQLGGTDVVLVVVGALPEDRPPGKAWITAAAVAVHVRCSFGGGAAS